MTEEQDRMTQERDDRTPRLTTGRAQAGFAGRSLSFTAWFVFGIGLLAILWATSLVSLRTAVVVSFLWLLVSSEVFAPQDPDSGWWRRLQWIKAGGWLALSYIIFERMAQVFPFL